MVQGAIAFDSWFLLLLTQSSKTAQRWCDVDWILLHLHGVPNANISRTFPLPHTALISQRVLQCVQMFARPPYFTITHELVTFGR
ncbi:hypothetical protein NPIL_663531 [Nephila pilipes]|uniref:Secreted protein n=1 Tax=Nephila pilipes TaxID=299642 RepID=A0A8X6TQW2_NEPPI|nr:hypothetical protein NPIL_663531 [Nephila pilipes]